MNSEVPFDCTYYEGFWSFRNEQVEVLMDEATFERYLHAYLVSHGMETRTQAELLEYAALVDKQHFEAETVLFNPTYWLEIIDPQIRIIQVQKSQQSVLTDESNATGKEA